ncbi:processed acidic surface protein [Metabacillus litoralis]|uniref:processed acidic surface protein n=1 Tax=Metabacillus litoralis TaxID=152268 RepID=UPI001CFF547A|nr:processed acidic surface protein [Metabacillus litoralis]
MKKKVIPFAVVSTLVFAPLSAGAVEYKEVKEQYPAVTSWTEVDWNNYLEENYGSQLDDYDNMNELKADIGEPIDINQLADGNLDQNILDIIERYNMDTNQLVAFLEEYDNRDNIHFVGDLVKSLDEEWTVNENDSTNNDGDVASENNNEDNASDNSNANGANEPAETETLDEALLEETYLVPLGWTVDEFNQYLVDNYDTDLNDYTLFEDLVSQVGPLITDENERELIEKYGLTPVEYEVLLAEYGERPDDYYFLYDLRESLDYYNSDQPEEAATEKGGDMPDTATNSLTNALLGVGLFMLGGITLRARKYFGDR